MKLEANLKKHSKKRKTFLPVKPLNQKLRSSQVGICVPFARNRIGKTDYTKDV